MASSDYAINRQLDVLNRAYKNTINNNFDVTSGIYGEQARLQRQVGTAIAASGGNVSGTFNKLPLFSIGSEFAEKRMAARTAYEQARIMNLLNISQGFGQNAQLKMQKQQMDYDQAFNIGDILGLFNINANINPFGGSNNNQ